MGFSFSSPFCYVRCCFCQTFKQCVQKGQRSLFISQNIGQTQAWFMKDLALCSKLLCGQAAVTGSAWMAHLRRCRHRREPVPKPTPTPGTAPSHHPQLRSRAAKRVGCTSTAPRGSISAWTVRRTSARPVQASPKVVPCSATSVSVSEPQLFSGKS